MMMSYENRLKEWIENRINELTTELVSHVKLREWNDVKRIIGIINEYIDDIEDIIYAERRFKELKQ